MMGVMENEKKYDVVSKPKLTTEHETKLRVFLDVAQMKFDLTESALKTMDTKTAALLVAEIIVLLGYLTSISGAPRYTLAVMMFGFVFLVASLVYIFNTLKPHDCNSPALYEAHLKDTADKMLRQLISNVLDATKRNKVILEKKVYLYRRAVVVLIPAVVVLAGCSFALA